MDRRFFLTSLIGTAAAAVMPGVAFAGEDIHVSGYGALLYGAPYTIAIEKGFFRSAGIDVSDVLSAKGGGTTVRNILAGGFPYGEVSLAAAITGRSAGLDIRIVNTAVDSATDYAWVVKPDSPLRTIADLAGRKAAINEARSVSDIILTLSLKAAGIEAKSVKRIALGGIGPGLTALESGVVDAAPIIEPITSLRAGRYRRLFAAEQFLQPMTQSVCVTSAAAIKEQPAKLHALVEGRRQGVDFLYAEPEASAAILSKAYDNLPREAATTAIRNLVALNFWSRGGFRRDGLDRMVEGLDLVGLAVGPVDWATIIDPQFLPTDLQRGL